MPSPLRIASVLALGEAPVASLYACPASKCWCSDRFSNSSISVLRDIPFVSVPNRYTGGNETLYLDLYSPPKTSNATRAAAVIIHGGGFSNDPNSTTNSASKHEAKFVKLALSFARRGILTISIDYRCERPLGQGSQFWTDAVSDARHAVDWLQRNQEQHAVDTTRIFAFGSSMPKQMAQEYMLQYRCRAACSMTAPAFRLIGTSGITCTPVHRVLHLSSTFTVRQIRSCRFVTPVIALRQRAGRMRVALPLTLATISQHVAHPMTWCPSKAQGTPPSTASTYLRSTRASGGSYWPN